MRFSRPILFVCFALLLSIPAIASAVGEGLPIDGGVRNPSENATQAYTQETEVIADTTTYGTRQSNKREGDGGGAIYGCRSNVGTEPCVRAINLRAGRAFEFQTSGTEGGRIQVGNVNGAPFTTNATGVATGLNADRVDGKDGADLDDAQTLAGRSAADFDDAQTLAGRTAASFASAGDIKFAVVEADADIARQRGGATDADIVDAPNNTYRVEFNQNVSDCSFTATPTGAETTETLAVQEGGNPNHVRIDADSPTGFHLHVIC